MYWLQAALVVLLIGAGGRLAGADSGEFNGVGEVRVVGGNQVSARRRALQIAQRDAVSRAAAAMTPPEWQERGAAQIARRVLDRYLRFVRNYRVVSEGPADGRVFRIEVAVSVRIKQLQQQVRSIIGGAVQAPLTTAGRPRVALWLGLAGGARALPLQLLEQARGALRAAGFESTVLTTVDGAPGPASSVPLPRLRQMALTKGAGLLLTVRLAAAQAPGVRGLGLRGALAEAKLEITSVADGAVLATGMERAPGYGQAADRMAIRRALSGGLRPLLVTLRQRWPAQASGMGERLIRITGLASFGQILKICQVVDERVSGVGGCQVRRLMARQAWFALDTRLSPKELAQRLAASRFEGFALAVRSEAPTPWFEVAAEPAPSVETR